MGRVVVWWQGPLGPEVRSFDSMDYAAAFLEGWVSQSHRRIVSFTRCVVQVE